MFTWVCCRGTLYGQHFKQICDPNKPKFHLSEVFLGDFDKKFHKEFVLFMLEVEELEVHFTLLCPRHSLLPASDVPKSKMHRKMMEFCKSSIDKKSFSIAQFSHFSLQKISNYLKFLSYELHFDMRL